MVNLIGTTKTGASIARVLGKMSAPLAQRGLAKPRNCSTNISLRPHYNMSSLSFNKWIIQWKCNAIIIRLAVVHFSFSCSPSPSPHCSRPGWPPLGRVRHGYYDSKGAKNVMFGEGTLVRTIVTTCLMCALMFTLTPRSIWAQYNPMGYETLHVYLRFESLQIYVLSLGLI